jgi:inner membrane protein
MKTVQIFWAALGLILLAAETMAPGAFMLWFGFAALAMFVVVLVMPGLGILTQTVLFVILSFISIMIYRQYFRGKAKESDQPLLNRRGDQMIGQVHVLDQAIVDGRGRVKIGDAFWTVEGPELPVGTRVRVQQVHSMVLIVGPAD